MIGSLVGVVKKHNPYNCTLIVTPVPGNGGPLGFELVEKPGGNQAEKVLEVTNQVTNQVPKVRHLGYYEDQYTLKISGPPNKV
jgi:hypothetical protein